MCLIVSSENNMFIAKNDIVVYKRLKRHYYCGDSEFITYCQNFPVQLNSDMIPKEKPTLREYGSKYRLDEGVIHAFTEVPVKGVFFEAIIKKGTKFWVQDDLEEIAAEKLYLTDKRAYFESYNKPMDFSDYYYLERGVDVRLKNKKKDVN